MTPAETASAGAATRLVPVTPERHGSRFWRRFASWEFVRAHRAVPIVLGEHEQVAASLPIVFMRTGAGLWPVALTRLTDRGTCALVSPGGQWRGSYVPSILRVHPFGARRNEAGDLGLLVDETSGLVTDDPDDEPFFTPDGTPAPALGEVIDFFQKRAAAETKTRAAMAEIVARAAPVPFSAPDAVGQMDVEGLFVPDRARIDGLGRTDLGALHRCGALALLQVQAVSLHHLPFLAAAEAQLDQAPRQGRDTAPASPATAPGDDALSGFLDALADSRVRDTGDATSTDDEKSDDVSKP
ncbi:SapC family protein [Roseovarius tibetensis]|uniref:SapC family protein n=1 Tax=Roseovarius tibetensis TaxID=2685897 RepID=UPI003D7F530E